MRLKDITREFIYFIYLLIVNYTDVNGNNYFKKLFEECAGLWSIFHIEHEIPWLHIPAVLVLQVSV